MADADVARTRQPPGNCTSKSHAGSRGTLNSAKRTGLAGAVRRLSHTHFDNVFALIPSRRANARTVRPLAAKPANNSARRSRAAMRRPRVSRFSCPSISSAVISAITAG